MNQQSEMMSKESLKTPPYAWVVLFAIYMASLAAPLNLFKVPPMLTTLQPIFDLSKSSEGYLMSVFNIMGFILAIPAGFLLKRFGIKMTVLCAVGGIMIGASVGALSNTLEQLFIGRFIEGVGMGLIMVAAPLAISLWFPADKRGLPMGLWASCVGVGSVAMLVLGPILAAPAQTDPSLAQEYQWQAVWWAGAAFSAVAFIFFAVVFRLPKREEMAEPPAQSDSKSEPDAPVSLTKAMANPSLWLLSISFMCFNLVIMALNTFYPGFLENLLEYSKENASSTTSLLMLVAIFSGPAGSYISDRLKSRKIVIIAPFVVIALLFLFPFSITGWMIPLFLIAMGIVMGPVAPIILAAVPEVMKSPREIGIGMGVAAFGQNLGMVIGPILFGYLLDSTGSWTTTGYIMIPISVIGIIAAWMAKIR